MSEAAFFERDVLEAFAKYQDTDSGIMLLEAVRRCGQYKITMPPLVYDALCTALQRYHTGEARSLDEAFRAKREKSWNQSGHLNAYRKAWKVFVETRRLHEAGHPIDMELHQIVGEQFAISASTARKYWRQVSKELNTR